jgi:hypothetical protein
MTRRFDNAARAYLTDGFWPTLEGVPSASPRTLVVHQVSAATVRPVIAAHHYSRTMPDATRESFAAYYGQVLAGVVTYGTGVGMAQFGAVLPGLRVGQCRELTRLWSPDGMPRNTESRIIADSLSMLVGVTLVLSYADPSRGHVGTIYQATNWLYLGMTEGGSRLRDENGHEVHQRLLGIYRLRHPQRFANMTNDEIRAALGWTTIDNAPKHRYAMLLGNRHERTAARRRMAMAPQPYPKR